MPAQRGGHPGEVLDGEVPSGTSFGELTEQDLNAIGRTVATEQGGTAQT